MGGFNALIRESNKVVMLSPRALQSEIRVLSIAYASHSVLPGILLLAYPPPQTYSNIKRFKTISSLYNLCNCGTIMKIIPVIDILNGIVVHGKKGKRKQYMPLKSLLSRSVNPIEIARIFKKIGFNDLYLADLDSIMGNSANFKIYTQILKKSNQNLMVDAGISDITKAERVIETGVSKIIIGSETLNNLDFVKKSIKKFGQNRIIVSVDIKEGKLLSNSKKINFMSINQFIQRIEKLGIKKIILLDLDLVGTQSGINFELIKKILKMTKMKIIVGGGIKDIQELEMLRKFGIYGVLIASVLHNENNAMDELKNLGFL